MARFWWLVTWGDYERELGRPEHARWYYERALALTRNGGDWGVTVQRVQQRLEALDTPEVVTGLPLLTDFSRPVVDPGLRGLGKDAVPPISRSGALREAAATMPGSGTPTRRLRRVGVLPARHVV